MESGDGSKRGEKKHEKIQHQVLVHLVYSSAIAYVLMLLKFPILPAFSFLKLDFSEIPL